jgi:hypothetical protein
MKLFKHHSLLNLMIHRCLSSEKPTLYETLKVIQPAETLFVYPYRTSVFGGQIIGPAMYAAQQTLTKNYPLHIVFILIFLQQLIIHLVFHIQLNDYVIGNMAHQPVMPTAGKVALM